MTFKTDPIDWKTISDWQTANLVLLRVPGLFRFLGNGKVMFIGYAASSSTGLSARLLTYRRGGATAQKAGRLIYRHQADLELQIATMNEHPAEIRNLCKEMIKDDRPPWNEKNRFPGRF